MLLVRPLLRTNRDRHVKAHLPVFFIVIVSNCGGLLTPLGDPPLFLGFLGGVDFSWTLHLAPQWLMVNGYLLTLFYFTDRRAWRRETLQDVRDEQIHVHPLRLYGWMLNLPLMLGVVGAVLAKKHITVFPICEIIMVLCAAVSWRFTRRSVREANEYDWAPLLEVGILFIAIFITMVPLLALLREHGRAVALTEPWQYFWVTGLFSSGLDNAPTYVALANLAAVNAGVEDLHTLSLARPDLLAAVSCGAVFFGANSYIGNGPNFMVKAIAESHGYSLPGFFRYVMMTALILVPVYGALTVLFFL
jgi:Na+/H+ antiporter NhaD/arsenite permease-like protein